MLGASDFLSELALARLGAEEDRAYNQVRSMFANNPDAASRIGQWAATWPNVPVEASVPLAMMGVDPLSDEAAEIAARSSELAASESRRNGRISSSPLPDHLRGGVSPIEDPRERVILGPRGEAVTESPPTTPRALPDEPPEESPLWKDVPRWLMVGFEAAWQELQSTLIRRPAAIAEASRRPDDTGLRPVGRGSFQMANPLSGTVAGMLGGVFAGRGREDFTAEDARQAFASVPVDPGIQAVAQRIRGEENPFEFGEGLIPSYEEDPRVRAVMAERRSQTFRGVPDVSLGRVVWNPIGQLYGPDHTAFNLLSGATDAAAILVADPADVALRGVGKAHKAVTSFDSFKTQELLDLAQETGAVAGHRPGVFHLSAQEFFQTARGRSFADRIAESTSVRDISRRTNLTDVDVLRALADTDNPADVMEILTRETARGTFRRAPTGGIAINTLESLSSRITRTPDVNLIRGSGDPTRLGRISPLLDESADPIYALRTQGRRIADRIGHTPFGDNPITRRLFTSEARPGTLSHLLADMYDNSVTLTDPNVGWAQVDNFLQAGGVDPERSEKIIRAFMDAEAPGARLRVVNRAIDEVINAIPVADEAAEKTIRRQFHDYIKFELAQVDDTVRYTVDQHGRKVDLLARLSPDGTFSDKAHLLSEMGLDTAWLPDARTLRNTHSSFRRINNALRTHVPGLDPLTPDQTSLIMQGLDAGNKMWKALRLARIAYPVRVLSEEQIRMSVAGYDTILNHPFRYIAWVLSGHQTGRIARNFEEMTDIVGNPVSMAEWYREGQQSITHWITGTRPTRRANVWSDASKASNPIAHRRGWTQELVQLANDPIARALASGEDVPTVISRLDGGDMDPVRRQLIRDTKDETMAELLQTPDGVRLHVEQTAARLANKTGGAGDILHVPSNRVLTPDEAADMIASGTPRSEFAYSVTPGGSELYEVISSGRLGNLNLRALQGPKEFRKLSDRLGDRFWDGFAPDHVKVPREFLDPEALDKKGLDAALHWMFGWLMGKPTDFLSRGPTLRQAYVNRVEELLPSATPQVRDEILTNLRDANIPRSRLRQITRRYLDAEEAGLTGQIDDINELNAMAGGLALDDTKKLLYDLAKRSNFFDSTRVVFPFGEAWREILTTWVRLTAENPHIFRRAQLGVEGARDMGFFSPDPSTGEEMFYMPGMDMLSRALLGSNNRSRVRFASFAEGLNLVASGGLFPGFGDTVAIPYSLLRKNEPSVDWLADTLDLADEVILPFGNRDVVSTGTLEEVAFPTWFWRLSQAMFASPEPGSTQSEELARESADAMRYLIYTGDFDIYNDDPEIAAAEWDRLEEAALENGRQNMFIRGLANLIAPTGMVTRNEFAVRGEEAERVAGIFGIDPQEVGEPIETTPDPMTLEPVELEDPRWLPLRVLADEWADSVENVTSDAEYQQKAAEFRQRFGIDPLALAAGRTKFKFQIHTHTKGAEWERRNPDIVDDYPNTQYYLAPDDGTFDWNAWSRAKARGEIFTMPLSEYRAKQEDLAGRMEYERFRMMLDVLSEDMSADERQAILRAKRQELEGRYEGFRNPPARQFGQLKDQIAELYEIAEDPRLEDNETAQAISEYLDWRETMRQEMVAEGIAAENRFDVSFSSDEARFYAEVLMAVGENLTREYPMFDRVWRNVLMRELEDD